MGILPNNPKISFYEWLSQFRKKDTGRGDLAKSISLDESLSDIDWENMDISTQKELLQQHLRSNLASTSFLDTLDEAFRPMRRTNQYRMGKLITHLGMMTG